MNTITDPIKFTDNRRMAKFLYWVGWRVVEIADYLELPAPTVHSWAKRDEWDKASPLERIEGATEARLVQLIVKDKKSGGDFKEIDLLHRQLERQARIKKFIGGGNERDLNPNIESRLQAAKEARTKRNEFTEEQLEQLEEIFRDTCFDYQLDWYRAGNQRTRVILKSRQIGATFYFAREALLDAVTTGRNQIFLSASKSQAHVSRGYIVEFANEAGIELAGDPITLSNGASLYFLGTNAKTAQGYHGNFYFDEFFWVHGFNELNKVASGMAMHKKWRKTYYSTPSSMAHEAYAFWTGTRFNRGRAKKDHLDIDVSHASLQMGRLCEDKMWRQVVTVMDAAQRGCDLFDVDELRFDYSAEEFANLLMCEFVDDGASIFPLAMLQPCMVDSWEVWAEDYKPFATRPLSNKPVWVGYDPAEAGDSAGLVVIAPPAIAGGKFRVLERHQFKGMDFAAQAAFIKKITQTYNVTYIGIDSTGMGTGVAQLVRQFFPALTTFSYNLEVKTRLVLKAYDVIKNGRLEFDAGWLDLAQSMMAIRKTITAGGRQFTYTAGRTDDIGHADLAWALMHALHNEPLEGMTTSNGSFMEIY